METMTSYEERLFLKVTAAAVGAGVLTQEDREMLDDWLLERDEYNGWKNYPTWNINLWLSNDEGLYNRTLETLAGAKESYAIGHDEGMSWRLFVADWLEDFVNEDLLADGLAPQSSSDSPASMIDDLAQWALAHVDWLELADAWIETVNALED